jgi:outer membrane lipoprotein carrier protein
MPAPILSYYLAFLFQTGQVVTPAAPAPAVAKPQPVEPTTITTLVVTEEARPGRRPPVAEGELDLGVDLTTSTAGMVVASADTADEVVENVQKFYKDIERVTAKFRQTVTNPTFGRTTKTDGVVWIKKPGKMRWDYYAKKKKGAKKAKVTKNFISNGTYLYVVDHGNKQVIEKNLEKNMLPVAVTFLYGKGDLKKDFDAKLDTSKKYGGKGDLVLELTPKEKTTQYKTLYLVVDKDQFRVKESIIIDGAGATNHFRFYEPNFKKEVDDSWFVFNKKSVPDYRVSTDDDAAGDTKKKGDKKDTE